MLPLFYYTRRRYGFTLVELLVVILILAILLSVALPLYTNSIADAAKKSARTNMATIATAAAAYRVRSASHSYPQDFATLVAGGDISNITGPGNRTYVLLGVGNDTTTQCITPVVTNGTLAPTMTPIPPGSFAVTTVINGVTQGQNMADSDDWCYIPGVSAE
jgi:prepilin-type N-terminal cleavage/methylation domain-containing protein